MIRPAPSFPRRPAPTPRIPVSPPPGSRLRVAPGPDNRRTSLLRAAIRSAETASRGMRVASLAPLALCLLTLLCAIARQGRLLEIVYPAGAVCVGLLLVRRYPAHYVSFLCWLMFLSPEVRRLADFFNGFFNPTSAIQVAPVAVAALSFFTMARHYRMLGQRQGLPYLLILVGLAYAYPVGILRNSPLAATWSFVQWGLPVMVGFHVMATAPHWVDYRRLIVKTFEWGTLVMGVYGLIQFFFLPPWDAFWLIASQLVTEGQPVPLGVRVSSTMNSSGPFAFTMVVGLLLLTANAKKTSIVSGVAGATSLLLSVVRAAWGGWLVGLCYLIANLNHAMRMRIIGAVMTLAILAIPAAMTEPISTILAARFATFTNLSGDSSFKDRTNFYDTFLGTAFSEIGGAGLGISGDATRLNGTTDTGHIASFDSGLMEIPYTLGWASAILFYSGVIWLMARSIAAARRLRQDRIISAFVSTSLALTAMLIFVNTLTGSTGMFFYVSVALPLVFARKATR